MLAYRIPTTNKGKNSFLVIAVLLLMWPAIFVEPLAAGAIDWETFIVPVFNGTRYGSSCSGEKKSWSEWTSDIANRHIYLGKASQEYIGLSQVEAEEFGPEYLCQRYIYTTDHWPLNSVIRDINLPCIAISEISWDTTPPLGVVQDLLLNSTNLSLSTDIPLFSKELVAKTTVILNLENWRDDTEAPPSLLFMGSKKVAVHLGFSVDLDSCHKLGSDRFGPSFPSSSAFFIPWTIMERGSEAHACFLIGTLNITAGVYQAPESILIAHKVVQATPTSVDQIQADIAVTPAFFMMPDLMTTITDQNLTRINAWGNIDHYIREIVSYSYFSSWDAMDGIFCDESEAFQFDVGIAVNMLTASVSKLRVSAWLAINLLFTLSGFVLLVIERKSESTRVVIDPAVAAILVDSSHVLQGGHNTADFSYTTKKDKGLGVLRLEKHENKHRFVRNEDGQ